eukprot:5561155-Alexandrium_andersonii.AAC.1
MVWRARLGRRGSRSRRLQSLPRLLPSITGAGPAPLLRQDGRGGPRLKVGAHGAAALQVQA